MAKRVIFPAKLETGVRPANEVRDIIHKTQPVQLERDEKKLASRYKRAAQRLAKKEQFLTQESEAVIDEVVRRVVKQRNAGTKKIHIGSVGLRGSGKSNIALQIQERLNAMGIKTAVHDTDTDRKPPEKQTRPGSLANPLNADLKHTSEIIKKFKRREAFSTRTYDYAEGKNAVTHNHDNDTEVLIVEGTHALSPLIGKTPDLRLFSYVEPGNQTLITAFRDWKTSRIIHENTKQIRDPDLEHRAGMSTRESKYAEHFVLPLLPTADIVYYRPWGKSAERVYKGIGTPNKYYLALVAREKHGLDIDKSSGKKSQR